MENKQSFLEENNTVILKKENYLPQPENEWLETGRFSVENVDVSGNTIRC